MAFNRLYRCFRFISFGVGKIAWLLRPLPVLIVCLTLSSPAQSLDENPYQLAMGKSDSGAFPITLTRFIDLVVERNQQLQSEETNLVVKKEGIRAARSIYEPVLVASYNHLYSNEQNDAAQFASRGFKETYEQEADNYKVEIEGLIPTGAQYRVGWTFSDTEDDLSDIGSQYRQISYLNLTQPLLKNAGIDTTNSQIRVAEKDADLALQDYRRELLNLVGRATVVYWDLFMAQEKLAMRNESSQVAMQILEDNRARFKTGKMAEIEVLEAEAGLALRKALATEAQKTYAAAKNEALTMFAAHAIAYDEKLLANEPLVLDDISYSYQNSIGKALKLRPEYIATHERLAQENIRLAYAKNQRWPELDLIASYGLNGLATDVSDSWDNMQDDEYHSWSVGLEFRIPLLGDWKTSSEQIQAEQRKRRALIEMKAIEVALANAVSTSILSIQSATEQARQTANVAEFNKRLLDIELIRLKAGKSNSRLVLEKEEDYRRARESEIEALISQKKAILELEMAEGSLLSRYQKEVMTEGI